jgi:Fur family ferric uptake transcriptional regulator
MSTPHDLKTIGLKATLPRLKILDLFENSSAPPHRRGRLQAAAQGGDGHRLATIYRVLTQFEAGWHSHPPPLRGRQGGVQAESGPPRPSGVRQCGHVEEFYDPEIERRQVKIAKDRGFHIQEHSLQIYAECTKTTCPYRPKP